MFRKSLNLKFKSLILIAASFTIGLSLPLKHARADIITDIDQLDKEKPEKEKKKDKEAAAKAKTPKPKEKDSSLETQPDKPDLIPEPTEEQVIAPPPPKPTKSASKAKGKTKEQRQKLPVHLQNDGTLTYSKDRSTVLLQKNVIITQEDLRLESEEAKVTLLPSGAAESGVKNALLTGKVAISRYSDDPSERMNAKSDKALFDNQAQTLALEGNARLWREGNLIQGDRIVYEITSGMIKVDKARGVVQPDRMNK